MKNKTKSQENFLFRLPLRAKGLEWTKSEEGLVTLQKPNTGFFNSMAQKLFKKPKISYIHLDKHGSFIWLLLDGEKTVEELGVLMKEKFGDDAEPLYERLSKYLSILESYGFVNWV